MTYSDSDNPPQTFPERRVVLAAGHVLYSASCQSVKESPAPHGKREDPVKMWTSRTTSVQRVVTFGKCLEVGRRREVGSLSTGAIPGALPSCEGTQIGEEEEELLGPMGAEKKSGMLVARKHGLWEGFEEACCLPRCPERWSWTEPEGGSVFGAR